MNPEQPFILLIEDEENDAWLFQRAWSAHSPLPIVWKATAMEALRFLEGPVRPALIVTDLKLPGLTGFEFLQQLRTTDTWREIPVLVLTSSPVRTDVDKAYECGAFGFIVKPVDFGELRTTARELAAHLHAADTLDGSQIPGWQSPQKSES